MKKVIGFLLLVVIVIIGIIFLGKNIILKEVLERKLTKINSAPVYIESVELSPFDNYITLKNVNITSLKNKKQFITMDELKTFYSIDYLNKIITLNDTEISNIIFFKDSDIDDDSEKEKASKMEIFSDRISKVEEDVKKEKVLSELKKLYLEKIDIDSSKIDIAIEQKYSELKKMGNKILNLKETNEVMDIKDSLKRIKQNKGKLSDILGEIGKIGKVSKKLIKDTNIDLLRDEIKDLKKAEEFREFLDDIIKDFLNKNKFVLTDLDTYINIYLNAIYEEKIYEYYLKYIKLLEEIEKRKANELENSNEDSWELYFKSISLTSNMYGIDFNGEIKNFSSKLSKNKDNIYFKFFGEKGQTIGELRGYFNLENYEPAARLSIPEVNSKDINSDIFKEGEATVEQYLLTEKGYLLIDGDINFKNIKLNSLKLMNYMKIEDILIREILSPILEEIREANISYRYDTYTRKLRVKSDLSEVFSKIINDENSSLKIKMREKIRNKYLEKN